MTSFEFSKFLIATEAFGNTFNSVYIQTIKEQCQILRSLISTIRKAGKKLIPLVVTFDPTPISGTIVFIIKALIKLNKEVDTIHKQLKELEEKIFSTLLEGKIRALKFCLGNLEDTNTSKTQKVAELVTAFFVLNEIFEVFEREDSIFRERYYVGAPLFVPFCAILNALCVIAECTKGYNTSKLSNLKQDYQRMLEWYTTKCIGGRMASCYVEGMLDVPKVRWTDDWDRHFEKYKGYYEHDCWKNSPEGGPWKKYAQDLGGGKRKLWRGSITYCNLIDTWETREDEQVKVEKLEITTSSSLVGRSQYHNDVLYIYRERVETVMLKFFNEFTIIL